MKDPLQPEKTPYEILGIAENAEQYEINKAFKDRMKSGMPMSDVRKARDILVKPERRALKDIFLYSNPFLSQMEPAAGEEALAGRREITMNAWSTGLSKSFPNAAYLHSLAVLSYWWALRLEEEKRPKNGEDAERDVPGPPAHADMWIDAIGYWSALISNPDLLNTWAAARENTDLEKLSGSLEMHFKNLFFEYEEKFRTGNQPEDEKRFRDYGLKFLTEVNAGRRLRGLNIKMEEEESGLYACGGRILLKNAGLLKSVKGRIRNSNREKEEKDAALLNLSELAEIAYLVDDKKYNDALSMLDALPEGKMISVDATKLYIQSYRWKGVAAFSADRFDEANELWKKALDLAGVLSDGGNCPQCR